MKDYKDMTPQEQEEFMKAMTEADRIWEEWKLNGRPKTSRLLRREYKQNHRLN